MSRVIQDDATENRATENRATENRARLEHASELGRRGLRTRSVRRLTDHELCLEGRREVIAANRSSARRWLRMVELYRRRLDTEKVRKEASPHFALTARQEVKVELGELWAMDPARVAKDLNVALFLAQSGEDIWAMCQDGQLDAYKATLVADAARIHLDGPEEIAGFLRAMTRFLRKHLTRLDETHHDLDTGHHDHARADDGDALVGCTIKQLRNAIAYQLRKRRPAATDEQFRANYAARGVSVREDVTGLASLATLNRADRVRLADHRLALEARRLRAQGDERTIQQLKADLLLDLVIGDKGSIPVPAYARPIVNVTVPIQTLMGLGEDPGIASGGGVVPAALARMIAHQPGSTWHRMLTDQAGHLVGLSTKSYRPTGPIWQHVVAEHATCFRPTCSTPATEGDLDHRIAWPLGKTDTTNLWPGCRTDHRTKHAPGFGIEQTPDGAYALKTPAGFRHRINRTTHPASTDFTLPDIGIEDAEPFQFTATELTDAITYLRILDRHHRTPPPEQYWEIDFDDGLTEPQSLATYDPAA